MDSLNLQGNKSRGHASLGLNWLLFLNAVKLNGRMKLHKRRKRQHLTKYFQVDSLRATICFQLPCSRPYGPASDWKVHP